MIAALNLPLPASRQTALAQDPGGNWSDFVNISHTPTASTNPCITADAAGNVHVLWSENVGGQTRNLLFEPDGSPALDSRGNQLNYLYAAGNTLFYTRWDGKKWIEPVDVQLSPSGLADHPEAVVDGRGVLHVVWSSTEGALARLYYSQVPASKAESAHEWREPIVLAEPTLFAYYPIDIATDPAGGVHVLYSQLGIEPGAYIINSSDGGNTWSDPLRLYSTTDAQGAQEGVSPLRLVADGKGRLHATWSRYGADGNGKGIYYSQSSDHGLTWSKPLEVAAWQPGWYEVDWLTAGAVGDEIHLVWEGSNRIAFLNERISHDGGVTWGGPQLILPNLRGENGFTDLVVDSADQLHLLVVLRGDSDSIAHGVWYTTWQASRWPDPILLGVPNTGLYSQVSQLTPSSLREMMRGTLTGAGLRYQRAAIVNGNQLFVVVVNEYDGDIWSNHTTLPAPAIPSRAYPPQPTAMPTQTSVPKTLTPSTPTPAFGTPINAAPVKSANAGDPILIGVLPALFLIIGTVAIIRHLRGVQR